MNCKYCNNPVPPNVNNCPSCGAPVEYPAPVQQMPQQQMPQQQMPQQPYMQQQMPQQPYMQQQMPQQPYMQQQMPQQPYMQHNPYMQMMPPKSRVTYILLGLFLGGLGVHNFYAGYKGKGIAQLLITLFLSFLILPLFIVGIWVLVEICTVKFDSNGIQMI